MTSPTTQYLRTTTEREWIQRLVDEIDRWEPTCNVDKELLSEARAYLDQSEPEVPTDDELLERMPKTMRDDFAYSAKVCSDLTGGQVKPGIFRVSLNHSALEYARAVLARWGAR